MSAGELAAFLAMSPPRRVPPGVQRAARRLGVPIFVAIMGGLSLVAGSFLAVWFFPWRYLEDRQLRAADSATAPGRVTAVAKTAMRIDKRSVFHYEFEFQADGARASGVCYTTGSAWTEGAEVSVRYRAEEPAVSCIAGARRSPGDGTSALVLLFPLMGAGLIAWHVISRRRIQALLEEGSIVEARVTAVEETRKRVNRRRVFRIVVQPADGSLAIETALPDIIAFARTRMEEQQNVLVLYDPAHRKRALLPEAL